MNYKGWGEFATILGLGIWHHIETNMSYNIGQIRKYYKDTGLLLWVNNDMLVKNKQKSVKDTVLFTSILI